MHRFDDADGFTALHAFASTPWRSRSPPFRSFSSAQPHHSQVTSWTAGRMVNDWEEKRERREQTECRWCACRRRRARGQVVTANNSGTVRELVNAGNRRRDAHQNHVASISGAQHNAAQEEASEHAVHASAARGTQMPINAAEALLLSSLWSPRWSHACSQPNQNLTQKRQP